MTILSIFSGGVPFSLTNHMSRYGRDVIMIRNTVPVSVGSPPTTTQRVVPAPQGRGQTERFGDASIVGRALITIVGWRGVSGQTTFDVQHGDKFSLDGTWYRVMSVDDATPGQREALAEALK